MVDVTEQHDLRGQPPDRLIIRPSMLGDFVFDDELDGYLVSFSPVLRRHDEPVATGPKLVFEFVLADKVPIEMVVGGEAGRMKTGFRVICHGCARRR